MKDKKDSSKVILGNGTMTKISSIVRLNGGSNKILNTGRMIGEVVGNMIPTTRIKILIKLARKGNSTSLTQPSTITSTKTIKDIPV